MDKKSIKYKNPGSSSITRFERIHTEIFDDKKNAEFLIAKEIKKLIEKNNKKNKTTVLGLATGSSPLGVYKNLIDFHKNEKLSFKNVVTFNLDEYYGLEKDHKQSYHHFMDENLFNHIDIKRSNINIPDGFIDKKNIDKYCKEYEKKIESLGGIDIQILGIGVNGHIGFNEPGSNLNSITRLVKLDYQTRNDARLDFNGIKNVPTSAITMGIKTILNSKRIILIAWGQEKSEAIRRAVELRKNIKIPASLLQSHNNTTFILDNLSSALLTRISQPWQVGQLSLDDEMITRSIHWLSAKTEKPILRLTEQDYNQNNLSDLLVDKSHYDLNLSVFNKIQRTITGWPGGKPNEDDTHRPERKNPDKKRVLIFSPHPDDDVVSMGGTFDRLVSQGHDVHVAYQTSGNIAVANEEVLKFVELYEDFFDRSSNFIKELKDLLSDHKKIIKDLRVRKLASLIRQKESLAATRFIGLNDSNVHFMGLPFYETGQIKKNKPGSTDLKIMCDLIKLIKPHQIFAAGDLADPHGTHKVCIELLFNSLKKLKKLDFMKDCWVWLYRGAWHEWESYEVDMAVPLSPEQVLKKRRAIFYHQSQNNNVMFQGDDEREFWQRVEQRNRDSAIRYNELGMADYQAMETFRRYHF
jgi:glucosamine-6-phosphate deaminase